MRYLATTTHRVYCYEHEATVRLLKTFNSREELSLAMDNAAGHFHLITGVYNQIADNLLRETTLYMRDNGLLRQKIKHLANIARQDVDRWRKQMRSVTLFYSYDAFEAAIIDHIGPVQPYIDSVEMQIKQYLTMHGCKDVELCTKVSLTYIMLGMAQRAHDSLIEAFKCDAGIDFGDAFTHCVLARATKAWKELSLAIVGKQAEGIENYQPLDTAMTIFVKHANDLNELCLKVCNAMHEYSDDFTKEQIADIDKDKADILQKRAEREKRIKRENEAAKKRLERQRAKRTSSEITTEDLQRLKEKFTA